MAERMQLIKGKKISLRSLPWLMTLATLLALSTLICVPLVDRVISSGQASALVEEVSETVGGLSGREALIASKADYRPAWLLSFDDQQPVLASWGNVGGCGVSGATATAGGFKWIGRGVSGGLVDVQCIASRNTYLDGASSLSFSTRLGTNLGYKWSVAATVPFIYNQEDVDSFGVEKRAYLPGFGDLSFEATRKLGITNAHSLTLALTAPTGAHDAVRKGVILPQRQQLGSGVMGASLTYEYTRDFDWGLMIFGGTLGWGGWENSVGDFRAPSLSGYVYAGYMLGPFVPSAGLTVTGRFMTDRERNVDVMNVREMFSINPTLGIEWSSDYLALMLSLSTPLSFQRMDSWTIGLGLQTSLF